MKDDDASLVIKSSPLEKVRDFFNVGKIKRMFRLGTEIFNAAQPFIEKQTPINAVKSAVMIGKVIVDDLEIWPDEYFNDGWESPYPIDFNKIILAALSGKPYQIIRTSDESLVIHMVSLTPDIKVGYVINTRSNFVDRICVQMEHLEEAKRIIKQELWSMLKNDNVVLRRVERKGDYDNCSVDFEIDDAFNPMPSKKASEYSSYLKKCIDAGVARSVLFFGPPGTGKSTTARTIISTLGLRSFRIRVEDVANISTSTIFEAISIFEPDSIIIDDFDRLGDQVAMLEVLEYFQRHTKLIIATVNDKRRLDDAILRPGRFDELLQIKSMDEEVVKNVLGEEHAESFELVKDWPIAFIQEFVKRRRFMTREEAEASTVELAQRVLAMSQYNDDDNEGIERIVRTKASKDSFTALDKLLDKKFKGKRGKKPNKLLFE